MLTVVDAYTRESLAIEVDTSLPGVRVARVLDRFIAERGAKPAGIRLDNGPELTSRALDQWAYERGVRLRFVEPGKPGPERPHRELQRPPARRMPERALVPYPRSRSGKSLKNGRWTTTKDAPSPRWENLTPLEFARLQEDTQIKQPEPAGLYL
jgi:transposase InsO family protein